MKISVTLTTKVLSNKENLISIRVYNCGKYKHFSTGVSCKKSNWNTRTCSVSSKDKYYKEKNTLISSKLEEIKKLYSNNNLSSSKIVSDLYDIIEKKIEDVESYSYKKNFMQLRNYLKEHFENIPIKDINTIFFNSFIEVLKKDKTEQQQNKLIKLFNIVYQYGLDNGYITQYTKFKYKKNTIPTNEKKHLNVTELSFVINQYKKLIHSNAIKKSNEDKEIYSLLLYILHIAFQGIAPIDMAKIKIKDLELEIVNTMNMDFEKLMNDKQYIDEFKNKNKKYKIVRVNFRRTKTNVMVNAYILLDIVKPILEVIINNKNENEYLTSCLNANKTYTDKQLQSRVSNYYANMTKHLNEYIQKIAKNYNFKIEHFTYYSARHTLTNYLINNNVNESTIKRLIGHKDSTLTKYYFADIDKIEQAELIAKIFNNTKRIADL